MRVINLDETGVKLLNKKKNQVYLNRNEINDFVNGNYSIVDNQLILNNKRLTLADEELKELPTILSYLKTLLLHNN